MKLVFDRVSDFFSYLLSPAGFMPRRVCGSWSPGLVMLHNFSDGLIGVSYFAIPAILVYFVRRRLDAPFRAIFWLFGMFIFACGLTHVLEIVVFYSPVYRLIGAVKLATALISAATALALIRVIPRALALSSFKVLERELEERHKAEEAAAIRLRQLETLVELSRRALATGDPDTLTEDVAELAASGLGVDLCGVFQALPGREELRLRAGVGVRDGLVGTATIPVGIGSLAGFVAREVGADLCPNLESDGRFEFSLVEPEQDAVCGLGVTINGQGGPHGLLVAYMARAEPFVLVAHAPKRPFGDDEVAFLRSVAGLLGSNLSRIEAERALTSQATTDGLTGLRNARHLREALPAIGTQAGRTEAGFSAIMIDIDRFKSYNDSFGHLGGDDVLCQVGAILKREARPLDLVARYGGEEFAIVVPGADAGEAREFAERIRHAIASHPWPLRPVTASLGVATGGPGGFSGVDLLAEADQALYVAKRTGRDRVVHHDDLGAGASSGPGLGQSEARDEPAAASPLGAVLLLVDADRCYRRELGRHLLSADLGVIAADTAAEGVRRASEGPDLILVDARLPDGDGFEFCRRLRADPATSMIPILMLSGTLIDAEDRARARAAGASAALTKTCEHQELLVVISAMLAARRSERELMRARQAMGERLRAQSAELEQVCDATIEGWARALELRDHETEGHSRRVAELTMRVARRMGLGEAELVHLRRGALLHDIGKVGVPDAILNKPGPLDEREWGLMRRHPELAYNLLRPIDFLRGSLDIPPRPSRALGRRRIPEGPPRRRDPALGPDLRGGRHLRRPEPRPAVPQGLAARAGQGLHPLPLRDPPRPDRGGRDPRGPVTPGRPAGTGTGVLVISASGGNPARRPRRGRPRSPRPGVRR